jgi:type II restriction enzyme
VAGGNSRSALETVLALTPNFFICYPQKSNPYTGRIEEDLKHIMWCPDDTHPLGEMKEKSFKQIISEIELNVDYGDMSLLLDSLGQEINSIEAKMHAQMQVACVRIGYALKFQTWIAKNDQTIKVGKLKLGQLQGVLKSLDDVQILYSLESKRAASLIDCIWFSEDFKYIPAVIEIEHSTGVTSGLTRMLKFKETIPSIDMTFTVIAPDELRNKVLLEANNPIFSSMKTRYMPYSAVRELYGLIQKYNLSNVVQRSFIEPFMEKIVE